MEILLKACFGCYLEDPIEEEPALNDNQIVPPRQQTASSYTRQIEEYQHFSVYAITQKSSSSDGSEEKSEIIKDQKVPVLPDSIAQISSKYMNIFQKTLYQFHPFRLLLANSIDIGKEDVDLEKQNNEKSKLADQFKQLKLELYEIIQKREEQRLQIQQIQQNQQTIDIESKFPLINQQVIKNIEDPDFQNDQKNIFIKLEVPCPQKCKCHSQTNVKEWCFIQCGHQGYLNQFGYLSCQEQDSKKCARDCILKINFLCDENGKQHKYNMFDLLYQIQGQDQKLSQEEKLTFLGTLIKCLILRDDKTSESDIVMYPIKKQFI